MFIFIIAWENKKYLTIVEILAFYSSAAYSVGLLYQISLLKTYIIKQQSVDLVDV